jgi:hypothetical protein
MQNLTCSTCGASTQTDGDIKACPACQTPVTVTHTAPVQSVAGNVTAIDAAIATAEKDLAVRSAAAAAAESAPVVEVPNPTASASASQPAPAPAPSVADKVETGMAIALDDVNAVAKLIAANFAGTPIEAIFKLLGPAAGIGAAVLHQHLQHASFDLSALKPAEIL